MPAKDPHSAAWPNRRSRHVETNNDNDDDANTGECELCTCRYRVAIVDSTVMRIRAGSSGWSELAPGGSRINGHFMPCSNVFVVVPQLVVDDDDDPPSDDTFCFVANTVRNGILFCNAVLLLLLLPTDTPDLLAVVD